MQPIVLVLRFVWTTGNWIWFMLDSPKTGRSLAAITADEISSLFHRPPRSGVPSAWYGHVPFAYWIVAALQPRLIVELGTHCGVSYAAFCDAVIKIKTDTRCYAVDTWKGDEHAGFYEELVFDDIQDFNTKHFGTFSELIRTTFQDACGYFVDGSIDLLHIDGCHTYESVKADFEMWHPKLSQQAVVLLHDTNVRERGFGVWKLWSELQARYPSFEFLHGHGLGILQVGDDMPAPVAELCALQDHDHIFAIRERFAFAGQLHASGSLELDKAHADAERLTGQLNDAHLLAQGIANARDAALAERDTARAERDAALAELDTAHAERNAALAEFEAARAELVSADQALQRLSADTKARERAAQVALAESRVSSEQTEAPFTQHIRHLERQLDDFRQVESSLEEQIRSLVRYRDAFEQSTAWQITWPLRRVGQHVPRPLRRVARRTLKAAWWTLTPLRIPARIEIWRDLHRRLASPDEEIAAGEPSPTPANPELGERAYVAGDRFSLRNIPPLRGDNAPALAWYDPLAPEVSIVVLNWNRSDMTVLCLQNLWQRTTGHRYEIIVVDNGSCPEDFAFLRGNVTMARIISLETNRYFGEANNIGVEAARGRYVCLLNNDAFVHEDWLVPLVSLLEAHPEAGAVGPRFLYPDGRLQEAGALVNPDGSVVQLGKGDTLDDAAIESVRQVDYVSAACVLVRRKDFLHVLGFDLTFDPAYYEDVDLCLKLRLTGLRTFYCPHATVTHIENATTSADAHHALQLGNIVAINRAKFVERWEAYLTTSGANKPNLVPLRPMPVVTGTGRPRVAIFTPFAITPGGGERYFLTIAEAFREVAEVTLITPHPFSRTRILTMGRDFGLQLDHIDQIRLADVDARPPFDLAFVVGNAIYPPVGRLATHNIFICQFPFPIENESYVQLVRPFWAMYDVVLTYSSFVRRHVGRMVESLALSARPIEVLSPPAPLLRPSAVKRPQILHVGRFFTGGHCKRQDVLIEAVRRLVAADVSTELHLAGSLHPEPEHRDYFAALVESAAGLPVHFHTNCSAETLQALYAQSLIYWHATGYGEDVERAPHLTEHFGISVVEAMSAGCIPIVFAAGGPVEVVTDGVTGFHFRTLDELCARTQTLIEDTPAEALATLAGAATDAARSYDEATFKMKVRTLAARFVAR